MIPELSVSDFNKSIKFYVNLLGFKVEYKRDEDNFAFLSYCDIQIMLEKINEYWKAGVLEHPYGRGINFQFKIKNVTELYKRLEKEDYPIFVELEENWYRVNDYYYGLKEFLIIDPDGYVLRFSEEIGIKEIEKDVSHEEMNC